MALFVISKRSNVRLGDIVERREGEFEGSPVFLHCDLDGYGERRTSPRS
jgi:hypothetical protein